MADRFEAKAFGEGGKKGDRLWVSDNYGENTGPIPAGFNDHIFIGIGPDDAFSPSAVLTLAEASALVDHLTRAIIICSTGKED